MVINPTATTKEEEKKRRRRLGSLSNACR